MYRDTAATDVLSDGDWSDPLDLATLDLAGSPDNVLAQIAALADRIREQTAPHRNTSRAS